MKPSTYRRGGLALAALLAAATLLAMRRRGRPAALPAAARVDPAECEVSECGPDGVPLSMYAG